MDETTRREALQMSRALTAMTDTAGAQPGTDTFVRDYVRAVLRQHRAAEDARLDRIRALEADGHRIINGGQTGDDSWEITDWRTDEMIADGTGNYQAYDDATARLDPDGKWLHIDTIDEELEDEEVVGMPPSLADALQDWLGSSATPDADVAEFTGWSVDDVARHREER